MFCPNCGSPQADGSMRCGSCGAFLNTPGPHAPHGHSLAPPGHPGGAPGPQGYVPSVDNHLVVAILTTLFCCLPAGVVAIVYASQVNTKLQVGDYEGAWAASKNAKLWSLISFFTVLIPAALYFLAMCGAVAIGGAAGY